MVNWLSDPASSFRGMLTSYPAWNLRSKPSTGLTGMAVQGISLRISCASRIAASEVKSLTTPPGPEAGIRVWAEPSELKTSRQGRNFAFPTHPQSITNLGTIAIGLKHLRYQCSRLHGNSRYSIMAQISKRARTKKRCTGKNRSEEH